MKESQSTRPRAYTNNALYQATNRVLRPSPTQTPRRFGGAIRSTATAPQPTRAAHPIAGPRTAHQGRPQPGGGEAALLIP